MRVDSVKLRIERLGPSFGEWPAWGSAPPPDEAFDPQFLPPPAQRAQRVVTFDAAVYDFRAWFVEAVLLPAADEDAAAMRAAGHARADRAAALRLPAGAVAPQARRGRAACEGAAGCALAAGANDDDKGDGSIARLLSNLHATPGALLQQQQQQGKQRANRMPWHRVYVRTLRAAAAGGEPRSSSCGGSDCGGGGGSGGGLAALLARRAAFEALLRRFVRGVVAPLLGCGADDVAYQALPTLRVSHPSERPMGHPHCDYEYGHQPAELNVWLPLTEAWGANTLLAESAPGRGDFAPLELGWGRCARFWGNQCRHYTVANDSGFTRVSLDLRCLDVRRFNRAFTGHGAGGHGGGDHRFRLGQFYASSRLPAAEAAAEAEAEAEGGGVWGRGRGVGVGRGCGGNATNESEP